MVDNFYYISVTCLLLQLFGVSVGFNCEKVNSCKCRLDDGSVIDLSPLATTNGEPRFKDLPDAGAGDLWSYNPCNGFTENSCTDVASCQLRGGAGYNAGTQESSLFQYNEQNGMAIVYSSTTDGVLRTTFVFLQCEELTEGQLNVLGELVADGNYYMYLNSKYACAVPDSSPSGTSSSLSGGSILLIIAVVLIFVYFAGGIVYQVMIRKAEGKERIPNLEFWVVLPGLVKDGIQFTYRSAKRKAGYESVA